MNIPISPGLADGTESKGGEPDIVTDPDHREIVALEAATVHGGKLELLPAWCDLFCRKHCLAGCTLMHTGRTIRHS